MRNLYFFYNGRSAINYVLNNLSLDGNDEVLYPEFSCDVLFQYAPKKFNYKFYKTNENFFFNINLIKKKISKNTKVLVVINFFGIKQNTSKLLNYCRKNNIYLIIDDCHTFYDLKKKINNHCDFKIFSPSKIFDNIPTGGILEVYNNDIVLNQNLKIMKVNDFGKNFFKNTIKKTKIFNDLKFSQTRPKFENPNAFKSKFIVKNYFINKNNFSNIKNTNLKKQKDISRVNYKFWKKISAKLKITPLIKFDYVKHGIPLYFVAKCKNSNQAKQIFDLGWKNKIEITSWPTLHPKMRKNKRIINYWKKLIFFPNSKKLFFKKEYINWKI
ncbi:aminotransferase class V-fold PLP-dependent enzyme [Candidatus Pelagibacter sp.]|nr:aminotransferase class V-fold PLP-dependent enzyme [Candidatus Pelagibacter sp.]